LTAQLTFCQTGTTNNYPRVAYPGEVVQDTCVQFTQEQAKLIAIDAINADACREENDSLKSAVKGFQKLVNLKNKEIRQLNFDIFVRNDIIDDYEKENNQIRGWWNDAEAKLKLTKKVDTIVYPVLGSLILTGILYIAITH
jgi:hypothetical protein